MQCKIRQKQDDRKDTHGHVSCMDVDQYIGLFFELGYPNRPIYLSSMDGYAFED